MDVVDFIPLVQAQAVLRRPCISYKMANSNIRNYCLGWMERVVTGQLPASHFMKTQYTIEQVDIRNARTRPQQLLPVPILNCTNWPDGTASEVAYASLPWQYPSRTVWPQPDDAGDDPEQSSEPIWSWPTMMTTGGNCFTKTG